MKKSIAKKIFYLLFRQIDQFNVEEEAFKWDTTNYPLRQQTLTQLQPYLKLYETGVEFTNKLMYVLKIY